MSRETIDDFENKSFPDTVRDVEEGFLRTVENTDGLDAVYEVREISRTLLEIVQETELPPKFEVRDITSSTNKVVKGKMELVASTPGLDVDSLIPKHMTAEYPLEFDDKTLKKAPWVNMVHGWMKVLNSLNSISAIQKKGIEELNSYDLETLASIAYDFYNLTLRGPEESKRKNLAFEAGGKYSETFRRESGELGVNAERKINFLELRYILNTVKESYSKEK